MINVKKFRNKTFRKSGNIEKKEKVEYRVIWRKRSNLSKRAKQGGRW